MALFVLAYLLTGGAIAWLCGVHKPLAVVVTLAFWPIISAIVIIDMARNPEG